MGQAFDAYRRRCVSPPRPQLVSNEDDSDSGHDGSDSDSSSSSDSVSDAVDSDHSKDTEEDEPVQEVKFECTEEGTFPDPNNCSRYFICTLKKKDKFKKSKLKCPKGQQFDVALQLCTDDVDVLCG